MYKYAILFFQWIFSRACVHWLINSLIGNPDRWTLFCVLCQDQQNYKEHIFSLLNILLRSTYYVHFHYFIPLPKRLMSSLCKLIIHTSKYSLYQYDKSKFLFNWNELFNFLSSWRYSICQSLYVACTLSLHLYIWIYWFNILQ